MYFWICEIGSAERGRRLLLLFYFLVNTLAHTINDIDNYCDKISASSTMEWAMWRSHSRLSYHHAIVLAKRRPTVACPEAVSRKIIGDD